MTIKMAVVGHTNTGKTSLIRTLLRSSDFGEVQDRAGTTRHVESALIPIDDNSGIELIDTPGLEDSSAFKRYLESLLTDQTSPRTALEQGIAREAATPEFEQEIKVVRQALHSHLLLYVIDCREPVFAKYLDEISVLKMAAIPILPVLNFIHSNESSVEQWRHKLAELGLHAHVSFDTVAYDFEAEKRLYQKLQTLLEKQYALIDKLIAKRRDDWHGLQTACSQSVAHLLFDVCRIEVSRKKDDDTRSVAQPLQEQVRAREQQTLTTILQLSQFKEHDVAMSELPVHDGQWKLDLFAPETLKTFGVDTASAAATGAAVGAGLDLMLAGLSLGAATATGAAVGAAWHSSRRFGKRWLGKLSGTQTVQVDDSTLDLLLLRQLWLLNVVFHRGHAAQTQASLKDKPKVTLPNDWPNLRSQLKASASGWGQPESEMLGALTRWIKEGINA